MPPGELLLDVTSGLEGLESFDDVKIGNLLKFRMLWGVSVLHRDDDSLSEEEAVDVVTVGLGDERRHFLKLCGSLYFFFFGNINTEDFYF